MNGQNNQSRATSTINPADDIDDKNSVKTSVPFQPNYLLPQKTDSLTIQDKKNN